MIGHRSPVPSGRSYVRSRRCTGSMLIEALLAMSLTAALGAGLVVSVAGWRQRTAILGDVARMRADAEATLALLEHSLRRAGDTGVPRAPAMASGPGIDCFGAAQQAVVRGKAGWRNCDLQRGIDTLSIAYSLDPFASWRDVDGNTADCTGAAQRVSFRQADMVRGGSTHWMTARFAVKAPTDADQAERLRGETSLYCKGSGNGRGAQAVSAGVERVGVWFDAAKVEVCVLMRGRVPMASPAPRRARGGDGHSGSARSGQDEMPLRRTGATAQSRDDCSMSLIARDDRNGDAGTRASGFPTRVQRRYVGPDGRLRATYRALWPIGSQH